MKNVTQVFNKNISTSWLHLDSTMNIMTMCTSVQSTFFAAQGTQKSCANEGPTTQMKQFNLSSFCANAIFWLSVLWSFKAFSLIWSWANSINKLHILRWANYASRQTRVKPATIYTCNDGLRLISIRRSFPVIGPFLPPKITFKQFAMYDEKQTKVKKSSSWENSLWN